MADLQFMEEMKDNVNGKLEISKTWIRSHKWQLTFASLTFLAFTAILSVSTFQQSQLQAKIDANAKLIHQLEKKNQNDTEANAKRISSLNEKVQFHVKAASATSCNELYEKGFSNSGYYLVDPDGRYAGQSSFEVYCDFITQPWSRSIDKIETRLRPKTRTIELSTESSRDQDIIWSRTSYGATSEEIQSLIHHSGHCYQEINIKCLVMPLHFEDVNHGFWLDRNGHMQTFFDGTDFSSRKCQCANEEAKCQGNKNALCNCDLRYKYGNEDKGTIRADWDLPITGFGYQFHGHSLNTFNLQNGSATVTIGDLVCQEEFDLTIVGPLKNSLGFFSSEKTILRNWGQKFSIYFELKVSKERPEEDLDEKCVDFIKIVSTKDDQIFTQVTFCDKAQNLTFHQMTDEGLKTATFHIPKIGKNVGFRAGPNWASILKETSRRPFLQTGDDWLQDEEIYYLSADKNNKINSDATKFVITSMRSEFAEVFDLIIKEEEPVKPNTVLWRFA